MSAVITGQIPNEPKIHSLKFLHKMCTVINVHLFIQPKNNN